MKKEPIKAKLIVLLVLIFTSVVLFFYDEIVNLFTRDKEREEILEKARQAKKEKSLLKNEENEAIEKD